ncbi:hypothetical protein QZH41_005829 [Actinostola sp. cb2023]|nr:hypothetical protein QZH41_005829 [Actinostola sp. cb2023]
MNKEQFPTAAETILESTYMDDSMTSTQDEQSGIELYHQLSKLWEKAGMHARKWISNSEKVLEEIPVEDRASEIDLTTGDLPSVKTLGVLWKAKEDVFTYKSQQLAENNEVLTKRSFLKKIATLFDPLGLLSPYTIRAKILMQELWTTGIDWDDQLMIDQVKQATKWFKELENLPSIQVPRCIQPALGDLVTMSLHTFTDASADAYGAVVYSRCEYKSGNIAIRIVASKSRVAPLKATSIPRLELMGAVLGLRLSLSISKVYKIDTRDLKFWSDSMNVLWWIQRPSRTFKPFVANRIGEIHSYSDPVQWRHVPTKENPADFVTRGLTVEELANKEMWWEGPSFLRKKAPEWPKSQISLDDAVNKEVKIKSLVNDHGQVRAMVTIKEDTPLRIEPIRFSSWLRLTRVQAWIYRFLDNCRLPKAKRTPGELTSEEITDAEVYIIKKAQRESFKEEYLALSEDKELPRHSKLLALKPTLDEDGLLRSDGRLVNADYLPYDTRFPIILPRKNWVTKLIVKDHHEKGNHRLGTNQTLSSLSTRFWIMQAREEIRDWERECYGCRRYKVVPAKQIMAPLPKIRLKLPLRAFARVAVDYVGPFVTIQGRSTRRAKRYLCLFTCLTSRAVHLEIAYSMDTDAFLNAFYRMVNRRGLPVEVLSDNGSNFIGGERELRELVEQLDKEKIERSAANKGNSLLKYGQVCKQGQIRNFDTFISKTKAEE